MSCIRHLSCSYWFLFVSKITHLALLSNGETWVFCGHCTHFPVAHSFMGNILVGPVGWKSLRCSIVFDTSLELWARKQNGSCLSFEDIWEQTQMHQLRVAATCLGEMWGCIQSNSANPNVSHPKWPWCMGSCETQQPACLPLSLYPAYSQLCHFTCKLEGTHSYPATFLIVSSLILAVCSFSRPNFCLLQAKKNSVKMSMSLALRVWHQLISEEQIIYYGLVP